MIRKLLLQLLLLFLIYASASAQTPEGINYQAIARDTSGNPLSQQALTIKLSIISGTANGPVTWQETNAVTTNIYGQYRLILGNGISTGAGSASAFSAISWGSSVYFLKTEVNAGSGFINMGTDPLNSVPYALYAKNVSSLPQSASIGQVLSWNGADWVATDVCDLLNVYYRDSDNDGFGDSLVSVHSCFLPSGYVSDHTDCNDLNSAIYPGAIEICNNIDDNCNGLIDDNAQTQSDPDNCGSCGNACPPVQNGVRTCSAGVCGFYCDPGFADCNNNIIDGCETDLNSSLLNCGNCNVVCPTRAHATTVCSGGVCSFICNAGYLDCDGIAANGCEVNISSNISNCGGCGNVCPTRPNASTVCSGGVCSYICNNGYLDCNANTADGCEVNITNDPSNCGGCGLSCPNRPNSTPVCNSGFCSYVCNPGFADCNGLVTDGCETDLNSTLNNCGNCGHICSAPNAVMACSGGVCFIAFCNSGFANCNGLPSDGCEVNLTNSNANCGSCGNICSGIQTCSGSTCH